MIPVGWLGFADSTSVWHFIAMMLISGGMYMFLVSLSPRPLRIWLWMFPITFFSAFQLVLLNLYGNGVIAVDMFLNVATTNPTEVEELLSGLLPALLEVAVLYVGPLITAYMASRKGERVAGRLRNAMLRTGVVAMTSGFVLCTVIPAKGNDRHVEDVFPLNAIENLTAAFSRWRQSENYAVTSRDYRFNAVSSNPDDIDETYVVVIGESSRAIDWQLAGYERNTNPCLSVRDDIYFFRRTLSESNTTHKSVPLLMSELDSHSFNDSVYRVKSFIEAFNEAGFHTSFISAQQPAGSYIDHFADEADIHLFVEGAHDGSRTDLDLLGYLDRELKAKHRKRFIVLHCYGSHYNYRDRYPEDMAAFRPDGPLESSPECREMLVNAYDNSIILTDSLLSGIIHRLERVNGIAAMIYTSDHGENIFDDDRNLFLHASPKTSYYQQHVPFLVWISEHFSNAHPEKAGLLRSNEDGKVSSSASFFHTVLDLGGIDCKAFNPGLSVGSDAYSSPATVFIDDHNDPVPMEEALSDSTDRKLLRRLGY